MGVSDKTMEQLCDEIAGVVVRDYDVGGAVTCRFLRHGFNDHFRVRAGHDEYHLRLYLDGKYYISGDGDIECELALVDALASSGGAVAAPIRRSDGSLLTIADLDQRPRRIALFEVAPGEVCERPTVEVAASIGSAVADLHAVADTAELPGTRYHLDERYLLRQPVQQLRRAAPDAPELPAIEELASELSELLAALPREAPSYGLIHADLHLGNMHFTSDGALQIFDFDHCAHGWRAYDFAPLRMSLDDECWSAFLAAYEERRELPPGTERTAELTKVRILWDIGDILAMEDTWGRPQLSAKLPEHLPQLAARLGVTP